jgi:hypothetical protein
MHLFNPIVPDDRSEGGHVDLCAERLVKEGLVKGNNLGDELEEARDVEDERKAKGD